jgi:pimeloyl-ACP methyl ester carboxylesterase
MSIINNFNNFNINILKNDKLFLYFQIGISLLLARSLFYNYCYARTFNRLDKLFPRKLSWEKELDIYSVSLPKFYTQNKKKKCILLISGYRDIPHIWSNLSEYFIENQMDFYAPRTFSNGRSFFQSSDPKDWVITYLEAITVLQEQYEQVDIIGFSTGCVIALYLTQFKFKCKISNLILCAPFLLCVENPINYLIFDSPIALIINRIINWLLPLRYKFTSTYPYPRDINYDEHARTDFYEMVGHFETEIKLMEFKKFRPSRIIADNVVIFYPNDDQIIGDIHEQRRIIENIWGNPIPIISIPNYEDITLPSKCGHVMFKEHPTIISNIWDNIAQFII